MMNALVVEILSDDKAFDCRVLDIGLNKQLTGIGKLSFRKILASAKLVLRVGKELQSFAPDFVYFTIAPAGYAFYRDLLFVTLFKVFRAKPILHLHGRGISARVERNPVLLLLYKWAFAHSQVIVLSESLRADVARVVADPKLHVLPNAVPDLFPDNSNVWDRPAMGRPRVLFLSNMIVNKGPLLLLEALGDLKNEGFSFSANFAGAWSSSLNAEKFEQEVRRLNLENEVSYLGPVFGADKVSLLEKSDLFVFPSFQEAFPLVLVEAMSAGLPVISTAQGGIPDLVLEGETGFLVPPRDKPGLSEALRTLLSDPDLRKKMGRCGRSRYEENYEISVYKKNLPRLLARLS